MLSSQLGAVIHRIAIPRSTSSVKQGETVHATWPRDQSVISSRFASDPLIKPHDACPEDHGGVRSNHRGDRPWVWSIFTEVPASYACPIYLNCPFPTVTIYDLSPPCSLQVESRILPFLLLICQIGATFAVVAARNNSASLCKDLLLASGAQMRPTYSCSAIELSCPFW